MAEPKTEQEPSIEEILESIRQIISDDTEAAPAAPGPDLSAKKTEEPAQTISFADEVEAQDKHVDNILDLTEVVKPAAATIDMHEDVEIDMRVSEPSPAPSYSRDIPAQEGKPAMADAHDLNTDPSILSDNTADAATAAMARLLASNVAVERDEPARVGRVTLEDLAREMMRPLIKTWLDQNLPKIIEKIVAREVEKLSRRALDQ